MEILYRFESCLYHYRHRPLDETHPGCIRDQTCFIVTMQALSGAGWDGIPSMAIIDNLIPFIMKEEEKLEKEGPKILGSIQGGKVISHPMGISTSCNRVGVMNGHTACVFVDTEKPATVEEAQKAFETFKDRHRI